MSRFSRHLELNTLVETLDLFFFCFWERTSYYLLNLILYQRVNPKNKEIWFTPSREFDFRFFLRCTTWASVAIAELRLFPFFSETTPSLVMNLPHFSLMLLPFRYIPLLSSYVSSTCFFWIWFVLIVVVLVIFIIVIVVVIVTIIIIICFLNRWSTCIGGYLFVWFWFRVRSEW